MPLITTTFSNPPTHMGLCVLGQPWEQMPVGAPHAKQGLKLQLNPRGCATEGDELKYFLMAAQTGFILL